MAERGQEIVSVEEAKAAMRLVGEDALLDAEIASYIEAAAQWIETQCKIGLVDGDVRCIGHVASEADPLIIDHRSNAVASLRVRAAGDETAAYVAIEQAPITDVPKQSRYNAPNGGWPARTLDVLYRATTAADKVPASLRSAMLLLVRDIFDMKGQLKPATWAVVQLIAPYRDMRS